MVQSRIVEVRPPAGECVHKVPVEKADPDFLNDAQPLARRQVQVRHIDQSLHIEVAGLLRARTATAKVRDGQRGSGAASAAGVLALRPGHAYCYCYAAGKHWRRTMLRRTKLSGYPLFSERGVRSPTDMGARR
jgi:hypothetical protein